MITNFIPYPKEKIISIQVLAERYVDSPSKKKEEEMLVLLEDSLVKRCKFLRVRDKTLDDMGELDDLVQIARVSVIKAMKSYKKDKCLFKNWLSRIIWQDIGNYRQLEGVLFRIPRQLAKSFRVQYISMNDVSDFLEDKVTSVTLFKTEQERQSLLELFSAY